jgi:hypothetical protein
VEESSACIDGFPRLGLAADHHLNRFSGPEDHNYALVRQQIEVMVKTPRPIKRVFMVPFERDLTFLDRPDIMVKLDQMFKVHNRVALHGMSGVG